MANKGRGRKGGKHNRGFYFRSGRGWYALAEGLSYPLCGTDSEHLKDPKTPERLLREAHARWLTERDKADREARRAEQSRAKEAAAVTVLQVCQSYLANAKATGAAKTHEDLFDFCFGLPPEFRTKNDKQQQPLTAARKKAMAAKRIHEGYGKLPVVDLLPLHVDQWLNAHATWNGGRRSRVQAVKRALNYATEAGLIAANPIRGYLQWSEVDNERLWDAS